MTTLPIITISKRQRSLASVVLLMALGSVTLLLRFSHALQPNSFKTSSSSSLATALTTTSSAIAATDSSLFVPIPIPLSVPQPPLLQAATSPLYMVANYGLEKPPPISEFDLSVGRALDALRQDYPDILTRPPDYSIYADDIHVVDPSGVSLHGIKTYKNSFRILHAVIKVVYCPNRSHLTFRMCYDKARQNIRVHWNARILPRFSLFNMNPNGIRKALYVDGISIYELDKKTGLIVQHRIEHILMNNMPVVPEEGVFKALEQQHSLSIPSFSKQNVPAIAGGGGGGGDPMAGPSQRAQSTSMVTEFRPWHQLRQQQAPVSLFAMVKEQDGGESTVSATAAATSHGSTSPYDQYPDLDWEALEAKNKSRQKFGLKATTPEEFIKLQTEVADLAQQQRQRQQQQEQQRQQASAMKKQQSKPNFLQQLFGQVLQDTCESNYDCERPLVCCDFGLKKVCCSSGLPVINAPPQYATVPVPQGIEDNSGYPPGRGPSGGGSGSDRLW